MQKEYTCIICPRSCSLILEEKNGNFIVTGNSCRRGEEYAINEFTNPVRMITTTLHVTGSNLKCLPVISSGAVPREKLKDCLEYLYQLEIKAPVKLHDVLVENILGTGISILAARDADVSI